MAETFKGRKLLWKRDVLSQWGQVALCALDHFTATVVGHTLYLFTTGVLFGLDFREGAWFRVSQRGWLPGTRRLHSQVLCRDRLLLYGGLLEQGLSVADGAQFAFDLCTQTWSRDFHRISPGRCFGHTADYVEATDEVVLFGGRVDETYRNEVYILNVERMRWTLIFARGEPPSPRYRHSSCVSKGRLFVFGGRAKKNKPFNDLYELDVNSSQARWCRIICDYKPTRRFAARMEVYEEHVILLGGITVGKHISSMVDTVDIFDTRQAAWFQGTTQEGIDNGLRMIGSCPPAGRYSSGNTGSKVLVTGSPTIGDAFCDMYELSIE